MQWSKQVELWGCIEEAECAVTDESLQLAVLRDPRAVTVSSYFHLLNYKHKMEFVSLDTYFQRMLGVVCMWTTLRHMLFTRQLANQAQVVWFEDLVSNPVDWHGRFFAFVGVTLEGGVVEHIAQFASGGGRLFGNIVKGLDEHPGGLAPSPNRSFADELGPESLALMGEVMENWLPPEILKRFKALG